MDRLMQFFRSFRTLALIGCLTAPMLPLPRLTSSAVANEIPVGGDASLSGSIVAFSNDGSQPKAVPVYGFYALVDVNGDGFADLIYAVPNSTRSSTSSVYVQYSNGSSFGPRVAVATDSSYTGRYCTASGFCSTWPQAAITAVGDVNGDGRPDILFANGTVALNNGSGFNPETAWGGDASLSGSIVAFSNDGSQPKAVPVYGFYALVDVNGDGFADLIYAVPNSTRSSTSSVYVQYSNGSSFGPRVAVATDSSYTGRYCTASGFCSTWPQAAITAVGDVNGDGRPDILFANGTVALNNGSGFNPETAWGGDASLSGSIVAFSNDGSQPKAVPVYGFYALVDVNGDGFADLIYAVPNSTRSSTSSVYVQYSNGSSFGPRVAVATDSSYTGRYCTASGFCSTWPQAAITAVGDVNGDGRPDILFANGTVALNNGSGFNPETAWGGDA